MKRLSRSFFQEPTLDVAKNLIGKVLHYKGFEGIITETEAYIGQDDPACHAARGKTPRNAVMFGPAGFSYVYFIYGMYHCLNIVTEDIGVPAAVLIRGLKMKTPQLLLDGPGKLCRHLQMTREQNDIDLVESKDFYIKDSDHKVVFKETPRIGIKVGIDKLWRFVAV